MASAPASSALLESYCGSYPSEAAEAFEAAPFDEAAELIGRMPPEVAAKVMERLSTEAAAEILQRTDQEGAARMLAQVEPGWSAVLLSRIDETTRQGLLDRLPRSIQKEVQGLLSHPEGTAGRLMDPRVHAFRGDVTAADALDRLRRVGGRGVHDVFVVDDEGALAGTVMLQALALAAPRDRLGALSRPAAAQVPVVAGQEEVAELLEQHTFVSLPVVDFEGRLVGVMRPRALMDVLEQEATADMQSMVGASKDERALSTVSFAVRKRLPWLQINLATAFLAASVVGLFEETIAKFTALAVLLPVVAGQSGNTGSQALAVTLRGLALREIRLGQWPRVTLKEAGVGVLNGVAVALVTGLGVFLWSGSMGLCLVIAVAMVLSMAIAGVTGALIPIVLTALGQDPAQSSSIVLTTVTDVVGFFSFLGLATLCAGLL